MSGFDHYAWTLALALPLMSTVANNQPMRGVDAPWVVVPMFNESSSISTVVSDLREHFEHILCIDDGSSDDSAELARQSGAVVVRHPVNLGQGAALQTGFDYLVRHTSATHAVTFDADGQHLADDAQRMFEVARRNDLDVVLASRFQGRTHAMPLARRAVLRGAIWLSRRTSGLPLTDTHNGLRVLSRKAMSTIKLRQTRMAYASELESAIMQHGLSWAEEPATVVYTEYSRRKGQRNINAVNIVFDLALQRLRHAP
jgi:glycosyltransferase involved in cell wall biosynthesis